MATSTSLGFATYPVALIMDIASTFTKKCLPFEGLGPLAIDAVEIKGTPPSVRGRRLPIL